jgi:hypothetical protein
VPQRFSLHECRCVATISRVTPLIRLTVQTVRRFQDDGHGAAVHYQLGYGAAPPFLASSVAPASRPRCQRAHDANVHHTTPVTEDRRRAGSWSAHLPGRWPSRHARCPGQCAALLDRACDGVVSEPVSALSYRRAGLGRARAVSSPAACTQTPEPSPPPKGIMDCDHKTRLGRGQAERASR